MTRLRPGLLSLLMVAGGALGTATAFAAQHAPYRATGAKHGRDHALASSYEHEPREPHRHRERARRALHRPQPTSTRRTHAPAAAAPARDAAREASVAKVLATACANAQLTPEPGNLALIREAVLCLVNKERAQHGVAPLSAQPNLERAGEAHAQEMIAVDYFDHVSPSGLTPVGRAREDGYISDPQAGYVIGENLAWGTYSLATPEAVVAAWIASPGHLANILEAEYRDTGVGVVAAAPSMLADNAPGATYAQEFGVIVR